MKRTVDIKQVDAFTQQAFGGNPAAVVANANSLTDKEMQAIANEMNLSETAFVLSSNKADFRLRWFTTEKEVLFCGHATIASLHVLAEEGLYGMEKEGDYSLTIETLVGNLPVMINKTQSNINISLEAPQAQLINETISLNKLAEAFEIEDTALAAKLPLMRDKTVDYLFVPVKDLDSLKSVQYNYSKLKAFGAEHNIKGFCVFSQGTYDINSDVSSRFFSPYYDVIEDPVTGSANAPLAVYLVENNLIDMREDTVIVNAEQGDILNRPGRLQVEVTKNSSGNYQSKLIGEAVTVLEGTINFMSF